MIKLKKIQDADIKDKTVFLRADLDVPLEPSAISHQPSAISDDTRLKAWLPTLEYLLKQDAKVIIAGHLGRPEPISNFPADSFQTGSRTNEIRRDNSQFSISEPELSLEPIARWLSDMVKSTHGIKPMDHKLVYDTALTEGFEISGNISILENLRFFKEEEENDKDFAKKLASLADIYVNDAFASSHRAHVSIVGITKYLPSYAGLRLQKEVEELSKVLENPKRPLTVIIGGAKIETKLPLVEKMHAFSDYVLVGGEIAENDKVLLKVQHERIQGQKAVLLVADLTQNSKDITMKSAENFVQIAKSSSTVIWNGPMGLVEEAENAKGTEILAKGLVNSSAYRIVGGGDTVAYLKKENLLNKFDFVSTGGGAMLEFLAGEVLPGLKVLQD